MEITDKELLAICNLSNLKMEFADVALERDLKGNILSNHTIYSLLEKELNGYNKRDELRKKYNFPELFTGIHSYIIDETSIKDSKIKADTEKEILKDKIEAECYDQDIGSFFRITNNKKRICIYNSKKELIDKAPIVMEYYDSLCEDSDKKNNVGAFLNEWEVIFAGDDYSIGKKTLELKEEKLKKEGVFKFDEAKKIIPTREEVEKEKINRNIFKGIKELSQNEITGEIVGEIAKKGVSKISEKLDFLDIDYAEHLGNIANFFENSITDKNSYNRYFKIKVSLVDEELKIVICRNKEKSIIVIAFENKTELNELENNLNKGILPKEMFALEQIYNDTKMKNPNYKIIFAGVGTAGKLATIYGLLYGEESKGFYLNQPTNISSIYKFSFQDLETTIENMTHYTKNIEADDIVSNLISSCLGYVSGVAVVVLIGNPLIAVLSTIGTIFYNLFRLANTFYKNEDIFENKKIILNILYKNELIKSKDNLNEITDEIFNTSKKYSYNYIDYFGKSQEFKNIPLELYLHLTLLEHLCNYKLFSIKNDVLELNRSNIGNILKIYLNKNNTIKKVEENIINPGHYNMEEFTTSNILTDERGTIGPAFCMLLKLFKNLQLAYIKKENCGYYFENNLPKKLEKLPDVFLEEKIILTEKMKRIEELYAPYLSSKENNPEVKKEENSEEDAAIKEKISDEYTASLLRSCVNANEDFKEKNINEKIENEDYSLITFGLSTPEDRETLNASLFKIVEERGKNIALPEHYESVMKKLRENPKSIEKYYFIKEDKYVKEKGELVIGIFDDEKKEFAPYKMGFAYSNLDKIKVGLSSIPLYFLDKVDVSSISTTKVCSGATLNCSCGTDPKKLMVTSHFSFTDNGNLIATSADKNPISNIGGFGGCKCHNKKPCINYINLSSWEGVSPNNTYKGNNLLLNVSTISCTEGGIITIEDSNCKTKAN